MAIHELPRLANSLPPYPIPSADTSPIAASPSSTYASPVYSYAILNRDETKDNLPGAGRGLDQLYQLSGRAFERWINSSADRLGFGPAAAERLILRSIHEAHSEGNVRAVKRTRNRCILESWRIRTATRKISSGSQKLVKYARSDVASTKQRALDSITMMVSRYPHIQDQFQNYRATETIVEVIEELAHDRAASAYQPWLFYDTKTIDSLFNSSRKALISVQDNELSRLAKSLVVWQSSTDHSADICARELARLEREWDVHGKTFLGYLRHPELSFLALRYLNNSIFYHPFIYDYIRGSKIRSLLFEELIALVQRLGFSNVQDSLLFSHPHDYAQAHSNYEKYSFAQFMLSHDIAFIETERSELSLSAERALAIGWMVSLSGQDVDDTGRTWLRILESAVESQELEIAHDLLTYGDPRQEEDRDISMYVKVGNQRLCYMRNAEGARVVRKAIGTAR